jgi:MYXO-CTERM domain-containing protein
MNLSSKFIGLLATGVTLASASAATIVSNVSDQEAASNGTLGALNNGNILAGAYYGAGPGTVPVFAFQLPDLGVGQSFGTASLTLNLTDTPGSFTFNGDVIGIRTAASSAVLGSDWATTGTMLQDNFLTPTTANGLHTTSNDFAGWMNTQYDGGANIGKYVFIKLDAEGYTGGSFFSGFFVSSANNGNAALRPTLTYSAVPEPSSSTTLLGLAGLALLLRRRI